MKFKNKHGESIELNAVGWDPTEDWLFIRVKGSVPEGNWEARDPCLQSNEAKSIIEWLNSVSKNNNSNITFLEPEIGFSYNNGVLKIFLEWKLRPPWMPSDNENEYYLSFDVSAQELQKQAKIWEADISNVIK